MSGTRCISVTISQQTIVRFPACVVCFSPCFANYPGCIAGRISHIAGHPASGVGLLRRIAGHLVSVVDLKACTAGHRTSVVGFPIMHCWPPNICCWSHRKHRLSRNMRFSFPTMHCWALTTVAESIEHGSRV